MFFPFLVCPVIFSNLKMQTLDHCFISMFFSMVYVLQRKSYRQTLKWDWCSWPACVKTRYLTNLKGRPYSCFSTPPPPPPPPPPLLFLTKDKCIFSCFVVVLFFLSKVPSARAKSFTLKMLCCNQALKSKMAVYFVCYRPPAKTFMLHCLSIVPCALLLIS